MDRDKMYGLLQGKFSRIEHELTPEGRTELDGILWALAQELTQESTCAKPKAGV